MNTQNLADEKELIELIKRDDDGAFRLLSRLYGNEIFLKAKSITKNNEDAEELTQDALLKIRKGIFSFRGDSSLKTWIFRIISNLSINRLNQAKRRHRDSTYSLDAPVAGDGAQPAQLADFVPADDLSPAEILEREDTEALMRRAMAALPREYAQIMDLRVARELSYEEIAERLNLSIGTVKSRIARAREALREKLAKLL